MGDEWLCASVGLSPEPRCGPGSRGHPSLPPPRDPMKVWGSATPVWGHIPARPHALSIPPAIRQDRHKHRDAGEGQGSWEVVNGDTQGHNSRKVVARWEGETRDTRRTRLYLRRRLHCKGAACTMRTETGLETTAHAARGHPHATHMPSLVLPQYRCSETLWPSTGGPFPCEPQPHWWGAAQLCHGEPRLDPAQYKCQGAKEMGVCVFELALSTPTRCSTELGLGCSPGVGCRDASPQAGSGVPPPADPHEEAPELPKRGCSRALLPSSALKHPKGQHCTSLCP